MAKVILGKGTALAVASASSASFTTLVQVVSIDPPDLEMNEVDQTHLASALETIRPGLLKKPSLSAQVFYDPKDTGHSSLRAMLTGGSASWFRITYVDPDTGSSYSTDTAQYYVVGFKPSGVEVNGNLVADLDLSAISIPVIA